MSKVYRVVVTAADKFVPSKLRPLWEHEAGPKTIFFWAPAFKWGLVMAGLGDLNRPVESLSIPQSVSLAATGLIWSRYSLALVMASIDDYRRDLAKVSTTQSATLAATGFIWTRYCLVIRPINYSLSLCNFALGLANAIQCFRAYNYQQKHNIVNQKNEEIETDM